MTPEEKQAEIKRLTKQIQDNAEVANSKKNDIKEAPKRNVQKNASRLLRLFLCV